MCFMPALTNPRYERFAQELAGGKTLEQAHGLAGFKVNRGNATTLKHKESIRSRIAEITETRQKADNQSLRRAVKQAGLTKQWVIERLMENVERSMQEQPVIGPGGKPTGTYTHNGQAANRALELLGKELGMFIERREQGRPGEFAGVSDEELDGRLIATLMERGMTEPQAREFINRVPVRGAVNGSPPHHATSVAEPAPSHFASASEI